METGENEMQSQVILLQIVLYLHTLSLFRPSNHTLTLTYIHSPVNFAYEFSTIPWLHGYIRLFDYFQNREFYCEIWLFFCQQSKLVFWDATKFDWETIIFFLFSRSIQSLWSFHECKVFDVRFKNPWNSLKKMRVQMCCAFVGFFFFFLEQFTSTLVNTK